MSDREPITLEADGEYITDDDRAKAMQLTMETGRPVIVNTRPRRRWWQFWKRRNTNG